MQHSNLERRVVARLREHGVRYTAARRRVTEALADADGPLSAAELHDDLQRQVPISSLYRSLAVLEDAGVVSPHHGIRRVTRYELAEWLSGHHHHLVCGDCGAVEDIHLEDDLEGALDGVVAVVSGAAGFQAVGHSLEIDGTCGRCA